MGDTPVVALADGGKPDSFARTEAQGKRTRAHLRLLKETELIGPRNRQLAGTRLSGTAISGSRRAGLTH